MKRKGKEREQKQTNKMRALGLSSFKLEPIELDDDEEEGEAEREHVIYVAPPLGLVPGNKLYLLSDQSVDRVQRLKRKCCCLPANGANDPIDLCVFLFLACSFWAVAIIVTNYFIGEYKGGEEIIGTGNNTFNHTD